MFILVSPKPPLEEKIQNNLSFFSEKEISGHSDLKHQTINISARDYSQNETQFTYDMFIDNIA